MNLMVRLWLTTLLLILASACGSDDPAFIASATSVNVPAGQSATSSTGPTAVASPTPAAMATARPAAESPATESRLQNLVEPTRVLSLLTGILTEENGCLRVKSDHDAPKSQGQALVWQKDIFEVERRADTLVIVDLFGQNGQPSPPVTWRLGDMIRGGGGAIEGPSYDYLDDHAEAGFSERCAGPYFLVSIVR